MHAAGGANGTGIELQGIANGIEALTGLYSHGRGAPSRRARTSLSHTVRVALGRYANSIVYISTRASQMGGVYDVVEISMISHFAYDVIQAVSTVEYKAVNKVC